MVEFAPVLLDNRRLNVGNSACSYMNTETSHCVFNHIIWWGANVSANSICLHPNRVCTCALNVNEHVALTRACYNALNGC
jgi:hypothetical protein